MHVSIYSFACLLCTPFHFYLILSLSLCVSLTLHLCACFTLFLPATFLRHPSHNSPLAHLKPIICGDFVLHCIFVPIFVSFVYLSIAFVCFVFLFQIDYISSPRPANSIKKIFDPSHLYAQPSKSIVRTNQPLPSTSSSSPSSSAQRPTLPPSSPGQNIRPNNVEPSTSSTSITFANPHLPKTSYLGETFKNSAHSSSQESNNSHSDHSGASGVTLPLDEPIEYADA